MREVLGPVLLNVLFLVAGGALLAATWSGPRRPGWLVPAIAMAHLSGAASVTLVGILLLVVGAGLSFPVFSVAVVAMTVALGAIAVRRHSVRTWPVKVRRPRLAVHPAGALVAVGICLFFGIQAAESSDLAPAWDAAHIWTFKAVMLLEHDTLIPEIFKSEAFAGSHLDYPIAHPVLGALLFRFAGTAEQGLVVSQVWVLLATSLGSVVFLLGSGRKALLALIPLVAVVLAPTSFGILRGDAELTMALFLAPGVLGLARAVDGHTAWLPLSVVLLGAAANTKNEGLAFVAVVVVVALALVLLRARALARSVALAAAAIALLVAPWRVWVSLNGPFPSDVTPLSTSLDPGFLSDHYPALAFATDTVVSLLAQQDQYGWVVPAFLALTVVAIGWRATRRLGAFYLVAGLGTIAAVLWVYWTSLQPDLEGHVLRTSIRTITGPLFIMAVGVGHLLACAASRDMAVAPSPRVDGHRQNPG